MLQYGIPDLMSTALIVIDVQEKLMPVIQEADSVFKNVNILLKGAEALKLPVVVTEQYPKGLGHTCQEIALSKEIPVLEKMSFSCISDDGIHSKLRQENIHSVILCGVESHICVLKTALEALAEGFQVHVVADAVSSRTPQNKQIALERLRQSGAFIVSTEMILFQLMERAGTDEFKTISKLIK